MKTNNNNILEILKINHISINQSKTQFILSYNKGIIIYDFEKIQKDSILKGNYFYNKKKK